MGLLACSCGRVGFDAVDATIACPLPYSRYANGGCYRELTGGSSVEIPWLDAELACEIDGAHLVVLDDQIEAAFVDSVVVPAGIVDYWVGTSDRVTEQVYLSVTNRAPGFLAFDIDEGTSATSDCLALSDGLVLIDDDCLAPNDYVCEIDGLAAVPSAY